MPPVLDPVYVNARREARFIMIAFAVFATYTVGVSYGFGYQPRDEAPRQAVTVLGMPDWVFWGIVVPWLLANIVTAWFCFGFMKHDVLVDDSAPNPQGSEASIAQAGLEPPSPVSNTGPGNEDE